MDKLRALGLDKNTLVFYTTDNGAWQDVYPDAGYTPFRGTKGTVREGGNRVPAIAVLAGQDQAGHEEPRHRRRPRPDGDLRLRRRREAAGEGPRRPADHLRQLRHDAGPARHRQVGRATSWFYFTENELSPGAARVGNYKAVFNLRGDDGAADRRPGGRHATSAGRARRSTSPPCRRSSTSGRTRRSATTSS